MVPDKKKDIAGTVDMLLVHGDVLVADRLQLVDRLLLQGNPKQKTKLFRVTLMRRKIILVRKEIV